MTYTDELLHKLLTMLNGDKTALKRLVIGAMQKYPSQSANWYLERVIADLHRDNG